MSEFAYNNTKNASTGYTLFELNCSYNLCVLFEKNIDPYSQSKIVDYLLAKLWELMIVY